MKTISEKQLAANRANAARSTGPRTPEGKARAALNSRKHGLAAATFTASGVEETAELEALIADAVAFYQPQNSQEQLAVERIALAQLAILRAYRLEAGALTSCFSEMMDGSTGQFEFASAPLDQRHNHAMVQGLQRQAARNNAFTLVLRYQAQADRQYRRAVEDFERLQAQREEIPNEPISEESEEDTPAPNEPVPVTRNALLRASARHPEAAPGPPATIDSCPPFTGLSPR